MTLKTGTLYSLGFDWVGILFFVLQRAAASNMSERSTVCEEDECETEMMEPRSPGQANFD